MTNNMTGLGGVLRQALAQQMQMLNVALPGQIIDYDAGAQNATVQPLLDFRPNDGEAERLPVLSDVPVIWPRSGGASMTFPVKPGDGCLLIFIDRSLDEWKHAGGSVAPEDTRAHAFSDAVALMGFVHFGGGGGPSDSVEIKMEGSTFTLTGNSVTLSTTSVTINASASTFNGNVMIAGNLGVTGDMDSQGPLNITGPSVTHNGKDIGASHTHGGVETGGGNTGVPN